MAAWDTDISYQNANWRLAFLLLIRFPVKEPGKAAEDRPRRGMSTFYVGHPDAVPASWAQHSLVMAIVRFGTMDAHWPFFFLCYSGFQVYNNNDNNN